MSHESPLHRMVMLYLREYGKTTINNMIHFFDVEDNSILIASEFPDIDVYKMVGVLVDLLNKGSVSVQYTEPGDYKLAIWAPIVTDANPLRDIMTGVRTVFYLDLSPFSPERRLGMAITDCVIPNSEFRAYGTKHFLGKFSIPESVWRPCEDGALDTQTEMLLDIGEDIARSKDKLSIVLLSNNLGSHALAQCLTRRCKSVSVHSRIKDIVGILQLRLPFSQTHKTTRDSSDDSREEEEKRKKKKRKV